MNENNLDKKKQKAVDRALLEEMGIDKEALKKMKKKLLKAEAKPERGIETWFRLTSKNLYSRLQIVDAKANILITSNAIIISLVLGTLYPKLADDPHLIYAIGGMIITNVLSIAYAILATIPNRSKEASPKGEMGKIDLMTFDDFHNLSLDEYGNAVMQTLEREERLYPSIITDIYELGTTLARKYKLIRISYQVFIIGISCSVFMFGFCHAFA